MVAFLYRNSSIATNVQQLCDGAAIEARQLNFAQKFNSSTTVEHLTSSRTIAKLPVACWRFHSIQPYFFVSHSLYFFSKKL
jgi:hypothetical protein